MCRVAEEPSRAVEPLEARRLFSAVSGFSLYNADTGAAIRPLVTGDVVDYATLATRNITVVAEADAATTGVKFSLNGDGDHHIESQHPFSVAGNVGAKLNAWKPSIGEHTLVAIPSAEGAGGDGAGVVFSVTDSGIVAPDTGEDDPETPAPAPGVTVGAADSGVDPHNQPPSVSLGATALGTFAGPAYSLLRASAADPDGSISKVEWYANGALVGQATSAPYMSAWREVPAGTYELTAKAYDNDGGTRVSAAGTIKVVAPRGDNVHVSTSGSDSSGNGSASKPFKSIRRAQSSADPGDTILIRPGTYKEEIRLDKSGTSEKPITFKAADGPGTVTIDADGREYLAVPDYAGAGKWTTFIGITFKNARNQPGQTTSAVKTADGWRLIDCHVQNVDGAAIGMFGKNVVLVRTSAEGNGCTGIGGSQLTNAMMLDCESHGNNTDQYSGGYEGGGGKFTKTNGLLVDNYHSYDNNGPGIWFDIGNANVAIRNGEFHDNRNLYRDDGSEKIGGRGVFFETSGIMADGGDIEAEGPMLVEHNTFWGNEHAGVDVYSTANAIVLDNTFNGDYINLKDGGREPYHVRNLRIVDNRLKDGHIFADSATVKDYKDEDFFIDRNTYDNGGDAILSWDGRKYERTSEVARALGFEKNGSLGTVNV
jgi:hypothetical protein